MTKFDRLTEFNPALIYAFEAEQPPSATGTYEDTLFPVTEQYIDMYNAYLYAQEEIVAPFQTMPGKAIDSTLFLFCIKKLHSLMGKTLLGLYGVNAGEYSQEGVMRWHKGMEMHDDIAFYFSGAHTCRDEPSFINFLHEKYGVAKNEMRAFMKLLSRVNGDDSIEIFESQKRGLSRIPEQYMKGIMLLNKLLAAYHSDKLTAEEKSDTAKIVNICLLPEKIPAAMDAYAAKTLAAFHHCDPANIDEVSNFLANLFYDFTEIHPFPNANGRVATCTMNIFLRFFNLPSILLRLPGDKGKEDSEYSKAIAQITTDREPLRQLIKKRIIEAQRKPFSDPALEKSVSLRLEFSELLQRIHVKDPTFPLDSISVDARTLSGALASCKNETEQSIVYISELIRIATNIEKQLGRTVKPIRPSLLSAVTADQKEQFKAGLSRLSGISDWKFLSRDGIVLWTESKDKAALEAAAEKLKAANVAKITFAHTKTDATNWVIKCEEINYKKLMDMTSSAAAAISSLPKPM